MGTALPRDPRFERVHLCRIEAAYRYEFLPTYRGVTYVAENSAKSDAAAAWQAGAD